MNPLLDDSADRPLPWAIDAVVRGYPGTRVLDGVTIASPPGAVVGLVGVNGSGKSTLLRVLVGLLRCDFGEATIDGVSAWDPPDRVKERLGYVDQQPAFFPWLPGRFLLSYFGSFHRRWDEPLLTRLAREWDVDLEKPFGKLSPGNRQKVALLLAMAHRPGLLVLDEPASALDPAARRAVLQQLVDLATADDGTPARRWCCPATSPPTSSVSPRTWRCWRLAASGLSPRSAS